MPKENSDSHSIAQPTLFDRVPDSLEVDDLDIPEWCRKKIDMGREKS